MAKFTAQQKIQAVQRYLEGTEGQESIANSIGVTSGVLITWIRLYQYHGESASGITITTYATLVKDQLIFGQVDWECISLFLSLGYGP